MEENKKRLKQYKFGEVTINYIVDIQQKYGLQSETETLRMIIKNQHSKEFPEYIQMARKRPKDPVDKAKAKIIAEESLKAERALTEQRKQESLCFLMDEATLIPHPANGRPACHYPVFTTDSPHKVSKTWYTEELDLLNDETPHLQYRGLFNETGPEGKAKVLEIIAKQNEITKAESSPNLTL